MKRKHSMHPVFETHIQTTHLVILKADITTLEVDAIVNAANTSLLGGGGVDGAIHRKAGPELVTECQTLNGCKTGEAKITKGYLLPTRFVIHTVGPIWQGGKAEEDALLASCYKNTLSLAWKNNLSSLAFPAISTGVYHFPAQRAASIAVSSVLQNLELYPLETIIFCCFSTESVNFHKQALEKTLTGKTYSRISSISRL